MHLRNMRAINLSRYLLVTFLFLSLSAADELNSPSGALHSRRKRYIVFPTGSSLQLVFCYTFFIENSPIYKIGLTTALAWMLPSDPSFFYKDKGQRFRRSIFRRVESFMNSKNINGRQCILKALCESQEKRVRTKTKSKSFIEELLHRVFIVPAVNDVDIDLSIYQQAYNSTVINCSEHYSCPFSLFSQAAS